VAESSGDRDTAQSRMKVAADLFQRAGQPLDAQRCHRALVDC